MHSGFSPQHNLIVTYFLSLIGKEVPLELHELHWASGPLFSQLLPHLKQFQQRKALMQKCLLEEKKRWIWSLNSLINVIYKLVFKKHLRFFYTPTSIQRIANSSFLTNKIRSCAWTFQLNTSGINLSILPTQKSDLNQVTVSGTNIHFKESMKTTIRNRQFHLQIPFLVKLLFIWKPDFLLHI